MGNYRNEIIEQKSMTPSQEEDMKRSIAEYTMPEMVTLAIKLQNTIDTHMAEKNGHQSAVAVMARQNAALIAENERLEALAENSTPSDKVTSLNARVEALTARVDELTQLNEGLTKKLLA